jgi:short-subunit dehydrogenase
MISNNARNLIFVSRSGARSEAAQAALRYFKNKGANVAVFECDISQRLSLAKVLATCQAQMPPIKGCIQGAMVLQVSHAVREAFP